MRIAILTFHRALSFGANLQCYALQETLKDLGCEAGVLDYRQPYIEEHYKPFQFSNIKQYLTHPRALIRYVLGWKDRKQLYQRFRSFQSRYLSHIQFDGRVLPASIDRLLIGSDQMWSINYTGGIDECYFGNIKHTDNQKIATYALSANETSLMQIGKEKLLKYANNFTSFSFRELNIASLFKQMTGRDSEICLDPTLLTTSDTWEPLINNKWKEHDYIVVFQVHAAGGDMTNAVNVANKIAKERYLRVININEMVIDPSEFITIIKNAQFVVTTSFHGTVFSLIFHREFVTLKVNDTIDARACDILNKLNIQQRLTSYTETIPPQSIDYSSVDSKLDELRQSSLEYIKSIIA